MFRVKFEETGEVYEVKFQHWRPRAAFINRDGSLVDVTALEAAGKNLLEGADAKRYNGITKAHIRVLVQPRNGPNNSDKARFEPLYEGLAHCYKTDQFDKTAGRWMSLVRAIEASSFERAEGSVFMYAYLTRSSVIVRTDGSIVRAKILKDEVVAAA